MKKLTGIYWIKNEARYLPEYMEFHLLQGFDHFIFYDNQSTDNLHEIISPYKEQGLVEIRNYPSGFLHNRVAPGSKNFWVMETCIQEQRNKSEWIFFNAIDQRAYCKSGESIPEFLKEFQQYGGLCIPWVNFNSNGHIKRPDGLITDNFTLCFDDLDYHIMTIIQPNKSELAAGNPHCFTYNNGFFSVLENHQRCDGPFSPGFVADRIRLHHYICMSLEEFELKMNKGLLDSSIHENRRRGYAEEQWYQLHEGISPYCKSKSPFYVNADLTKFSDSIRANIKERYQGREHLLEYINH